MANDSEKHVSPTVTPSLEVTTEDSSRKQPEVLECAVSGITDEEVWTSSPSNPKNWSTLRRWTIVVTLAVTNLVSAMTTAFEPALPSILEDFHVTDGNLGSLAVSVYTLGYCIGPLLIGPASEIYGRIWILRSAYLVFLVCLIVCGASSSIGLLIAFRGIMGLAGIVFVLLGPAMVPDLVAKERRGLAMSIMFSGASFGPTLGPVMGGFIAQRCGWRWIFWACAIAFGATAVPAMAFLQETYEPLLKARFQKASFRSRADPESGETLVEKHSSKSLKMRLRTAWLVPLRIFVRSPTVVIVAIYTTVTNGYLLLLISTLGVVFQSDYGFDAESSGLTYLGMTVGFFGAQVSLGYLSDAYIRRKTTRARLERQEGNRATIIQQNESQKSSTNAKIVQQPEWRLPPFVLGSVLLPISLFWYGWSAQLHAHWMVPIAASGFFTFSFMWTYLPLSLYLVDMYSKHAASAMASCTVIRSVSAAILPLAADPLYRNLGYGWGNSLLAFIALLFLPLAVFLWKFGGKIRQRYHLEEDDIVIR